jgi:hypothetical protein
MEVVFPERQPPQVAEYSIRKTYGKLLDLFETAFSRKQPLFTLAVYNPLAYYQGADIDEATLAIESNRQKQVVGLIRTLFLKRFESSPRAFEISCDRLLLKLLAWLEVHATSDHDHNRLEKWKVRRADLIGYVQHRQLELFGGDDEDIDEDIITPEMLEEVDELSPIDDYRISDMVDDTLDDLEVLADFLDELRKFKAKDDDKLRAVIEFERDQAFGLAIDDGMGEWFGRLRFEAIGESATRVSIVADVPGMPESADSSTLRTIAERWLNTENLI